MSDFTIFNFTTLETITCDAGDTVHVVMTLQPGNAETALNSLLGISHTSALDVVGGNAWWSYQGTQEGTFSGPAGPFSAQVPAIEFSMTAPNPQVSGAIYTASVWNTISGLSGSSGTSGGFRMVVHWVNDGGLLAPPVSWMPAGPLDLQWDMFRGSVASNALPTLTAGLKEGSDVVFAVLPSQAGTLITSGVTALSLVIRPAIGTPDCLPFFNEAPSVTQITVSGDEQYYALGFNLSSLALSNAFEALNSTLIQALSGTDQTAIANAQAAAASIACVLELRATYSSAIYTSLTFPLNILQALTP